MVLNEDRESIQSHLSLTINELQLIIEANDLVSYYFMHAAIALAI